MTKRRTPIVGDDIIILHSDNTETHARVITTLDTMFIVWTTDSRDVFLYYDLWKGTTWTFMEPS